MSVSLRDAVFAVDKAGTWSMRKSLSEGFWPALAPAPGGGASVRSFVKRFAKAGVQLRVLQSGTTDVWTHIDRATMVERIRERLRDPGIMHQNPSGLCGPLAVVMELARRRPAEYVRAATELFNTGKLTTMGGMVITAEQELREEPVPTGPDVPIRAPDWLLGATMRDDDNLWEDVDDDGEGIESITTWGVMSDWTQHMLGLKYHWETCFVGGEMDAIRTAQKAVDAGGVAFLLIDSDLIAGYKKGEPMDAEEEEMWWKRAGHHAREPVSKFGAKWTHSKDDNGPYPDHWVVLLGGLELPDGDDGDIRLRVWSWAGEYELQGKADSFTEYLWGIVTGVPA